MGRREAKGRVPSEVRGLGRRASAPCEGKSLCSPARRTIADEVYLQCVENPKRWVVHILKPLPIYSLDNVALLGDAVRLPSHPQ